METVILGISCNTRMLGLAVFKSNHLMDYSVKLHKERFSPKKIELFLSSLQSSRLTYTVSHIVLSMPLPHYQTDEFKALVEAIEGFAERNNLPLIRYSVADLYHAFGNRVKATRYSLMKRLEMFYPELEDIFLKEQRNKNKYYIKLFEAVAVGSYHILQLQVK